MTFPLPRQDRRWYSLPDLKAFDAAGVQISVPVDGWALTFDHGATWHRTQGNPDLPTAPACLTAGPDFPGPDDPSTHEPTEIVILHSVTPRVRLIDSPETTSEACEVIALI